MKFLKLVETDAELSAITALENPIVAMSDESGILRFIRKQEEGEEAYYLFKTAQYYPLEIDIKEWYEYDGTTNVDGKTYHKWVKQGADEFEGNAWVLTDTRDFSKVSVTNKYQPLGYMFADDLGMEPYEGTHYGDLIIYGGVEMPKDAEIKLPYHDTSTLNDNGIEYVDLGLPSGTKWATCNVGADSEEEYGDYFMWGSTTPDTDNVCDWANAPFNGDSTDFDYEYFKAHKSEWLDNGETLKPEYDAAHINMGGDWRMPTPEQLHELLLETDNQWVENYEGSGVKGWLFTSKVNDNTLFIPAAGYRSGSSFYDVGSYSYVWSSSLSLSGWDGAIYLNYVDMNYFERFDGFSVRGCLY